MTSLDNCYYWSKVSITSDDRSFQTLVVGPSGQCMSLPCVSDDAVHFAQDIEPSQPLVSVASHWPGLVALFLWVYHTLLGWTQRSSPRYGHFTEEGLALEICHFPLSNYHSWLSRI